jgi:UDP-N-acetylmuramoyl-L-alanyl-D-glutamate--2,6-diaminopimelate ligase
MRFSELIERIRGRVDVGDVRAWGRDPEILRVCEDSRKVREGDLFVARVGMKADGAQYIVDAMKKGAAALVGEMVLSVEGIPSAEVGNANLALALLAHKVAGNPTSGMKMIGVTGTKGKTTVAYLMRSVLKAAGKTVGMIGTVEIDDGVTVVPAEMTTPGVVELVELFSRMKANGVTHCVMEVSSHSLHQHRVAGIDWAVAMFTNLTGDHLDYHKTMDEYAAAKGMLFEGLREGAVAVVNADDAWGEKMAAGCRGKVVRYGIRPRNENSVVKDASKIIALTWVGQIQTMSINGMDLQILGPWISRLTGEAERGLLPVQTSLVGRHNVYNLLCVIAGATALGVCWENIAQAIEDDDGVPGRLQRVKAGMDFQVFVDYAHTHDSLENVLMAVRVTMGGGRLICVFGCGGDRDRTKRPKMGAVAERLADRVIVTSDNPRTEEPGAIIEEICAGFSAGWKDGGKISVEADRRAAIRMAIEMAKAGDVVLIAGKGHENYQIIGTTKHHFDDVEEAQAALAERYELRKQQ